MKRYNLNLLENLEKYELYTNPQEEEYYKKVSEKIDEISGKFNNLKKEHVYIHNVKEFYINNKVYYEIVFSKANDHFKKTDTTIAFTDKKITSNYAIELFLIESSIDILGNSVAVLIIDSFNIKIRKCEFDHFCKILHGSDFTEESGNVYELKLINQYLTKHKIDLLDLMIQDELIKEIKNEVLTKAKIHKKTPFLDVLLKCREKIDGCIKGYKIIKYLLFKMRNVIIKKQISITPNENISNLFLKNQCIPFENKPFYFSLVNHNTSTSDLAKIFNTDEHKDEILARQVKDNAESNFIIFNEIENENISTVKKMIDSFNNSLWSGHISDCEIKIYKNHLFMSKYVNEFNCIIKKLNDYAKTGYSDYSNFSKKWLNENNLDSEEKKKILRKIFINTKVAFVYGSAGSGKTTLIEQMCRMFNDKNKILLSHTNSSVNNLKERIKSPNTKFMTVTKYINSKQVLDCDLLLIDECSVITDSDINKVLEKNNSELLILVGDVFQIESIGYGKWFEYCKELMPKKTINELNEQYRTNNKSLHKIWKDVREKKKNSILTLNRFGISQSIGNTIFERKNNDEIILCPNYNGLYGINNINRILQEFNNNKAIPWGTQKFKVGDPVLFHSPELLGPEIHNNLKGKISKITKDSNNKYIEFHIELEVKLVPDQNNSKYDLLNNDDKSEKSIISFKVHNSNNTDSDKYDHSTIIPFQTSYAISIHKAQGLEYNSVKIVFSNTLENFTHNIFYTAITRAKENLQIYWEGDLEKQFFASLKSDNYKKDMWLLKNIISDKNKQN
ncbi:AAA family ATPase [Mycoplasma cottewii]|uniref:AAA family ATPase n=1 Tax=Mycoplasma cottewii TaxID=51364 RepID=A0ABY5TYI6_9MOLU|nr:AAA family ATPase [Mycoplasma cottewii]UWD34646.1 AAA family ATPase [Mycoplasma cottewii]